MTKTQKAAEVLKEKGYEIIQVIDGDCNCEFTIDGKLTLISSIYFEGTEFDLIITYELLEKLGYPIFEAKRVYQKDPLFNKHEKEIGKNWTAPHNELCFRFSQK